MSLNEKYLLAVQTHMPQVNIESLRRRLAPLDVQARYIAACMTVDDMREFGTAAQFRDARRNLAAVSEERRNILHS